MIPCAETARVIRGVGDQLHNTDPTDPCAWTARVIRGSKDQLHNTTWIRVRDGPCHPWLEDQLHPELQQPGRGG